MRGHLGLITSASTGRGARQAELHGHPCHRSELPERSPYFKPRSPSNQPGALQLARSLPVSAVCCSCSVLATRYANTPVSTGSAAPVWKALPIPGSSARQATRVAGSSPSTTGSAPIWTAIPAPRARMVHPHRR